MQLVEATDTRIGPPQYTIAQVRGYLYQALAGVINDRLPLKARLDRNEWGNWVVRVHFTSCAVAQPLVREVAVDMPQLVRLREWPLRDALEVLVNQVLLARHDMAQEHQRLVAVYEPGEGA